MIKIHHNQKKNEIMCFCTSLLIIILKIVENPRADLFFTIYFLSNIILTAASPSYRRLSLSLSHLYRALTYSVSYLYTVYTLTKGGLYINRELA